MSAPSLWLQPITGIADKSKAWFTGHSSQQNHPGNRTVVMMYYSSRPSVTIGDGTQTEKVMRIRKMYQKDSSGSISWCSNGNISKTKITNTEKEIVKAMREH